MRQLDDVGGRRDVSMGAMIGENVILDLVVSRKPQLAIRALVGFIRHDLMMRSPPWAGKGQATRL